MKRFVILALSVFSPLAAVPTGWAIYAGVTERPAFPMHPAAAGVGAVAIITTSIAAGLLVVDIIAYNQSMRNKTEREELTMPVWSAWAILGGCALAEVALSLLIVVIPGALNFGVLVFPLMTLAGVFAFAVRFSLQQREAEREQLRVSKKQDKKQVKQSKAKPKAEDLAPVVAPPAFMCATCGYEAKSQKALNGHKRKHAEKIAGYKVSFEPVTREVKP